MTRYGMNHFMALVCALLLAASPHVAHAATSYDSCTGFITALPAVISSPGTWCFNQNLSTGAGFNYGINTYAISVAADNVVIDCNGFLLDGSAGGLTTKTPGIFASNRHYVKVRRCNIRGFQKGVYFGGNTGGGYVIENNRFDANVFEGIEVSGHGSVIRHNRVLNTGGTSGSPIGIFAILDVDVLDNTISGVVAGSDQFAYGISTWDGNGNNVVGNRIHGLQHSGTSGDSIGIELITTRSTVRDNNLVGSGPHSTGIDCGSDNPNDTAKNNVISGFFNAIPGCKDGGGNVAIP